MNWPWHSHKWETVDTHYTPPIDLHGFKSEGYDVIRRAMEGSTSIYQKCSACGLVREQSVYGKYESPAND